jgi:hypothetical protein
MFLLASPSVASNSGVGVFWGVFTQNRQLQAVISSIHPPAIPKLWVFRIFREEGRILGMSVRTHTHTQNAGAYHGDSQRAKIIQPEQICQKNTEITMEYAFSEHGDNHRD